MGQKKKTMITIEVANAAGMKAIKALEEKKQIKIIDETDLNSPALPGNPLTDQELVEWLEKAEQTPTMSLEEAEILWAKSLARIRKLIR